MTTALQRTPVMGERWYFVLNGKILSGDVVCVERQTASQASPVKQIHLYRGRGQKEVRIPPAKLFKHHSGINRKKNKKLASIKLGPFDRGI